MASVTTLQDVRLELAKDDAASSAHGLVSPHKMTLTTFLITGLDLEDQQCVLHSSFFLQRLTYIFRRQLLLEVSRMKGTQTSKTLADLEVKRTALYGQIQQWREAQLVYMPCIAPLLSQTLTTTAESPPIEPAESILLHLPSSLPQSLRQSPELSPVVEKERRLRVAQADEALADVRRQHRIISGLWHFKKLNVDGTGNRTCTRMRTLYNRFSLRTQRCAGGYRAARNALVALDPDGSWQSRLKVLRDADIRGPGKDDDGVGNGRFEPSWIWLVPRVHSAPDLGTSEQVLDDSLQVEWSKSHARKQRWEEEVTIVLEEMRRVIAYHEWKAQWWRSQVARHPNTDAASLHGVAAYAEKQSHLSEQLARRCAECWLPALKEKGISPEWERCYPATTLVTHVERVVSFDFEDQGKGNLDDMAFEDFEEIDDKEQDPEKDGEDGDNSDSDDALDFFEEFD